MTTILAAIFVFGVLITVHEFGHFITAKIAAKIVVMSEFPLSLQVF